MEKTCELYMYYKSLKYIFTQLDFNLGIVANMEVMEMEVDSTLL
jgi:hypothetical protein